VTVRVLLVEDSDVYRSSLELLLGLEDGIDVVAAVAPREDAVAQAVTLRPDVALVDLRLPGMGGIETTRALLGATPGIAVVCLTAEATGDEQAEARAAGATAVLDKDQRPTLLADVLRGAVSVTDPQ
jgi:two-component system response regulator DesR